MSIILNFLVEVIASIATFIANFSTMASYISLMEEPVMPEELLEKM